MLSSSVLVLQNYCRKCQRRPEEPDGIFPRCSGCKWATYCSPECHLADWPKHKEKCRQKRAELDTYKKRGSKREFQLFQQWKVCVAHDHLPMAVMQFFGSNRQEDLQRKCVCLSIVFDYNICSFWPLEEPKLVSFDTLEQSVRDDYNKLSSAPDLFRDCVESIGTIHVLLTVPSIGAYSLINAYFPNPLPRHIDKMEWKSVTSPFSTVKLESSKFAEWKAQATKKWVDSVKNLQAEEGFLDFAWSALHMYSTQPKHLTHAIDIEVEIGYGLGEIKRLTGFHIIPFEKPSQDEEDTHAANAEDPEWLAFKTHNPNAVQLKVIFKCPRLQLAQQTNFCDANRAKNKGLSVEACERRAKKGFAKLSKYKFSQVQSPPLG